MKNLFFIIIYSLLTMNSFAQNTEEAVVAASVEQLRVAMINADKKLLEKITAEDLSYGHSSGLVEGKKEFIEKLITGKSDFVSIEISNQKIVVQGSSAIVRHELHAQTNDSGKAGEVHLKVLLVWHKYGKEWKLLARQAVK
jgi:ketosteroid isomerase-like protein